MTLADNTLHPLQIEDARAAAHRASELQRECEDQIRAAASTLADAERRYRHMLTLRMMDLHATDGVAWTSCESLAKGEQAIATKRYERDVAKGVLEAARQQAFRRGADRRDIQTLLDWSMRRDLRTDTPPPGFDP